MPGAKKCNQISDPVERKKCLEYKGKYAKSPVKGRARKTKGPAPSSGY